MGEDILTSNVKLPILPPVEHIGDESDPSSTNETWGGTEVVTEGRAGEKALWVLNVEIAIELSVVFSDSTLESAELELSQTNSDDTKLYKVRDCI